VALNKSGTIGHFNANGKLDGEADTYLNGKISRKARLKNGLFDGWMIDYYINGATKASTFYKNDKIDSIKINYYNTGEIKTKEYFKDGRYDGPKIMYYKNGEIEQKSLRKNNNVEGMEYAYYQDGHLKYERNWVNDKPYGDFYYYYENKTINVYHAYDILGDKFYLCRYDQSGKVYRSEGYVFSSHTYTKEEGSIQVLRNNDKYISIKDFYITVANPPQSTTEIQIKINKKLRQDLIFPDQNTVMIKNAFDHKGSYNIAIEGIFVGKSGVIDHTTGDLTIIKE
jgi:antitoxin component YwqK of YwqJK toxin-antitoxin module